MLQFMGSQRVGHDLTTTSVLMAESEKELKSLLMKVKKESKKSGLKHNIQKTKIMPFDMISSVQLLSHVQLCDPMDCSIPASLFIINSQSLLKLMSIESMMVSNHLILSSPSPPAFNLSQHQSLFQ